MVGAAPNILKRGPRPYRAHNDVTARKKIKADRPHWTPPDYWQIDNSNGLVMVIRNYHLLNSASRVLISICSAPLVQTGECKQFSLFDLVLWPTTLTYYSRPAKVKIDPHGKNQGQTVQTGERPQTNGRTYTHGRYQTRSIKMTKIGKFVNNCSL